MSVVLDRTSLHQRLKGKKTRLTRLVAVFLQHYPGQLAAIAAAIDQADAVLLREAAHTYKGTVNSFEARIATGLALELEQRGRDTLLEGVNEVFLSLARASEDLRIALEQELQDESWLE